MKNLKRGLNMDTDYKLMAVLIPIILVLCTVFYMFPNTSGVNAEIASAMLDQTNNSSINQTVSNTTVKTQSNPVNNQNSQVIINNNNTYSNNNKTSTNTNDNSTTEISNNIT